MLEDEDDELWPDPEFRQKVAAAISMDKKRKDELWNSYSSIWRNVLNRVLDWPEERTSRYIEELRQEMELNFQEPLTNIFGFFYDRRVRISFSQFSATDCMTEYCSATLTRRFLL